MLVWDEVGSRRYETGIDRGVLFLPEGGAVPWNGLESVDENESQEVTSYFMDGVKYLEHHILGSYSGSIKAFTYPDELDELVGLQPFAPGVFVHNQSAKTFGLSYRTKVGNDTDALEHGYKLHLLYNVMAVPGATSHSSIGEKVDPQTFQWDLAGTPPQVQGIKPTSHISLHSRSIDPDLLASIENDLYETNVLTPLVDLLAAIEEFYSS